MTLLAAGSMGEAVFDNDCSSNEYAPSDLKTAIDALAGKLTTKENAAVKKRTLTSGSHNGENTDCVAGGQVDNAVFWPLSSKEANAVKEDLRVVDPEHPTWATSHWWLRSPAPMLIMSPSWILMVLSTTLGTLSASTERGVCVPLLT